MLVVSESINEELERASTNLATLQFRISNKALRNNSHPAIREYTVLSTVIYAQYSFLTSQVSGIKDYTNENVKVSLFTLRYANNLAETL